MFRLVSINLNGIRSAAAKGLLPWAEKVGADCMGVQELKAQAGDLAGRFEHLGRLKGHFHLAEKKGYSGVGLYARRQPSDVRCGFGAPEFDAEGRYVEARFDTPRRRLSIISCYFPSGSAGEHRQQAKYRFLDAFWPHLLRLTAEREFILVGDINIAHREIDLKNWRSNQRNSGFLPAERAWMTRSLDELGLVDVHRKLRPEDTGEAYTWWSNRGQARANNVGWRIDYQLATPALAAKARRVEVYRAERFSDHAPLVVDYAFTL
ncbi:MAG TPA: exodeoxyribonuclease III [Ideonella sp.]|nr:exodeoxyribonuclease III [Ideonella sp.]